MSEARNLNGTKQNGTKQNGTWCDSAAEAVLTARQTAGLTQKQLAERLGTSPSVISQYENGRVEPTVWALDRIVRACGLTFRMHLEPSGPVPPEPDLAARRERVQRIMALRAQAHAEAEEMWGKPRIVPGFQEAALRAHHEYLQQSKGGGSV